MSALERAVAQVRPGLPLQTLAVHDDEVVLTGPVGCRPRLGDPAHDPASLPQAVRDALG